MARPKRETPNVTSSETGAPAGPPSNEGTEPAAGPTVATMTAPAESRTSSPGPTPTADRASIPMDPNGYFDAGKAQEKTKQQLRRLFSDPKIREKLGIPEELPAAEIVSDENVTILFQGISALEVGIAKVMKFDAGLAARVLPWTPAEVATCRPMVKRVLVRYSSRWLREHADLVYLGLMIGSVTYRKFQLLAHLSQNPKEAEGLDPAA